MAIRPDWCHGRPRHTYEEAASENASRSIIAIIASKNNWSSRDYYTRNFCEEYFDYVGSYRFEKRVKRGCIASFEPDAEEKVDKAYDDWWSGEYGAGA